MTARRIAALFLIFGVLWILVSDHALEFLVQSPDLRQELQSVKGSAFVLISAVLIFGLVRRAERERSRLEEGTRREKERLAEVLSVSPAVIYSLRPAPDGQTGFVVDFVGDKVVQVTGHPLAHWYASPDFWRKHIHPDDAARVDQAQAVLFQAGELRHEYRFLHADGQYRWINDSVILLRDALGQPRQITGAWLDITDRKLAELAMRDSEQRYRHLYFANPQPMYIHDEASLRFLSVNHAAVAKYGYTHDEFMQMTLKDIRPPDEVARLEAFVKPGQTGPDYPTTGVWRHRKKDGSEFWVDVAGHSLEFGGRQARLVLVTDITDRHQAEERLRLISHVFESSQEGICIMDAHNRYISVNRSFSTITGFAPEDVVGRTPSLHHSGRHDKAFYEAMWRQIQSEGRWEGEVWNRRKSGEIYPQWLAISVIRDSTGQVQQYLGIFTETSSRKAAEERIQRLANYDLLTNLPNRTLLCDRAKVAFAAAGRTHAPVVLMHLNIDHFKSVNESLGHEAGDEVLIAVARRLVELLRPEDTVSRMGGDDFVILLPHITSRDVATVAMRLMSSVAEPVSVGGQELRLTASVGIAEFPENGADLAQLTQAAESAVNQAKREGRNTFRFFSRGIQDQVKETLAVERDLRFAVERQQLVLHYQPQIDVPSGKLVGLEALVRWQHPEWGLVSPARFIPVAEASGLIREIGRWVLQTALTQNAAWAAQGRPIVPIAVNLSMAQFRDPGLRGSLIEALRISGLPAAMVELELTESVAMEDSDFTIATIDGLKRLGVALSIDDFGTGYSSLSYLKRFDVDKLKIDQSFVRGLKFDPQDEVIVLTVINLAHSLGLRTIAEGVETQDQLDFLREHGCDEYQGYLCSRPVPADEVVRWLSPSP